jgi:hypothetical protein
MRRIRIETAKSFKNLRPTFRILHNHLRASGLGRNHFPRFFAWKSSHRSFVPTTPLRAFMRWLWASPLRGCSTFESGSSLLTHT